MEYYTIEITRKRNVARIEQILGGLTEFRCKVENVCNFHPSGSMLVSIRNTGKYFGEVLIDMHWEEFTIISQSLKEYLLEKKYINESAFFKVNIEKPIPSRFKNSKIPNYYIINYCNIPKVPWNVGKFPYEIFGTCKECGRIIYDRKKYFSDITKGNAKRFPLDRTKIDNYHLFTIDIGKAIGSGVLVCSEEFKINVQKEFGNIFKYSDPWL